MFRKTICIAIAMTSTLCGSKCRATVKYTVTDLGTLGGAQSQSQATCINNLGQIIGQSSGQSFIWSGNGPMQPLGIADANAINDSGQIVGDDLFYNSPTSTAIPMYTPGGIDVDSIAMNNLGHVVGFDFDPNAINLGFEHAFLYHDGVVQDLSLSNPSTTSVAFGVNDLDDAVGRSYVTTSAGYVQHAFLWTKDGASKDLGTLGGELVDAIDINNFGQIVGRSGVPGDNTQHVFFTTSSSSAPLQDLGTLDGDSTFPSDINNVGQFVGAADHAFIGSLSTGLTDLNTLIDPTSGWVLLAANSINDSGDIVGYGTNPSGQTHAFLLTPIPEPFPFPLLAIPTTLLLRRQKRLVS